VVETNLARMARTSPSTENCRGGAHEYPDKIIRGRALADAAKKAKAFAIELLDIDPSAWTTSRKLARTNASRWV